MAVGDFDGPRMTIQTAETFSSSLPSTMQMKHSNVASSSMSAAMAHSMAESVESNHSMHSMAGSLAFAGRMSTMSSVNNILMDDIVCEMQTPGTGCYAEDEPLQEEFEVEDDEDEVDGVSFEVE